MNRAILLALCIVAFGCNASAAEKIPYSAAEMQALLGKGLSVASMDVEGGRYFTGRVDLATGGRLSGTLSVKGQAPVTLAGTWRLKGAQLCRTLGPVQPEEVCETWLKSGAREATIQINGQETSINRWQ